MMIRRHIYFAEVTCVTNKHAVDESRLEPKDRWSLSTLSYQRNVWCVPLPGYQGLGALWQLERAWCLQESPRYGFECRSCGRELHLCEGHAFSLVQLGALKIDTHPWLISPHLSLTDLHGEPSIILHTNSCCLMGSSSTFVAIFCTTHSKS